MNESQATMRAAELAFVHPADKIDRPAWGEDIDEEELFRRLLFACVLPPATPGAFKRSDPTYRRLAATVYVIAPEVYDGVTPSQIADALEMSEVGFQRLTENVRMAHEPLMRNGSFPRGTPVEVPRVPSPSP